MSASQDPLSERIMSLKDYTAAHRQITSIGILSGFGGGGLFTWGVYKFNPSIRRNILFLTFFTSSTILTLVSTNQLLSSFRSTSTTSQYPIAQSKSGLYTPRPADGVEDEDLSSWKRAEVQGMAFESGVGGLEGFHDKYASTRGDH